VPIITNMGERVSFSFKPTAHWPDGARVSRDGARRTAGWRAGPDSWVAARTQAATRGREGEPQWPSRVGRGVYGLQPPGTIQVRPEAPACRRGPRMMVEQFRMEIMQMKEK